MSYGDVYRVRDGTSPQTIYAMEVSPVGDLAPAPVVDALVLAGSPFYRDRRLRPGDIAPMLPAEPWVTRVEEDE